MGLRGPSFVQAILWYWHWMLLEGRSLLCDDHLEKHAPSVWIPCMQLRRSCVAPAAGAACMASVLRSGRLQQRGPRWMCDTRGPVEHCRHGSLRKTSRTMPVLFAALVGPVMMASVIQGEYCQGT